MGEGEGEGEVEEEREAREAEEERRSEGSEAAGMVLGGVGVVRWFGSGRWELARARARASAGGALCGRSTAGTGRSPERQRSGSRFGE